jgi:hypothetical protein
MEQSEARDLAEAWRRLGDGAASSQDVQAHLWRALTVLLPEGCVAAAVKFDDAPVIVAVTGGSLLETTVAAENSPPAIRVQLRAINPTMASVGLTETLEEVAQHPAVRGTARVRHWNFDPGDGGTTLNWTTRQMLFGGFDSERAVDRPERLARHVAAACGWNMPTMDATGPDWD